MASDTTATRHLIVMGVSGSGKSTLAGLLSELLELPMGEADDFHPESNVSKMRDGIALTDEDRWPWLRSLAEWMHSKADLGRGCVVTCSALKRSYRDLLREEAGAPVFFIHLDGDPALIKERMEVRSDHYMPTSLLQSQLDTLESLEADEPGMVLDIDATPRSWVTAVLDKLV